MRSKRSFMNNRMFVVLGVITLLAFSASAQELKLPKLDPIPSTERQSQLIKEGVALHDRGDYDGAVSRYAEVLRENPNNISALYEMSYSYFVKKDYQKSLDAAY